ncbi:MAG: TrmB family transcriptional regulator [Nanoarchaeota archaeon]
MDAKTALLEWGLAERESEVYLFLLKRGSESANEISKSTGILRQTIYEIIGKLESKGLINETTFNNKKYFEATSPEKLKDILEEKTRIIEDIMPSLESLKELDKKSSKTQMYLGKNGMKMVLRDPLNSKTEIKVILPNYSEEFFQDFFIQNFSINRLKKKIPIKILRAEIKTEFQKAVSMTNKKELREARTLGKIKDIKASFMHYDEKISIINFDESNPFAVLIKDEFISKSFELIYDILWTMGREI